MNTYMVITRQMTRQNTEDVLQLAFIQVIFPCVQITKLNIPTPPSTAPHAPTIHTAPMFCAESIKSNTFISNHQLVE